MPQLQAWWLLYSLNPMVAVIDGFRWCILRGQSEPVSARGCSASGVMIAFFLWFGVDVPQHGKEFRGPDLTVDEEPCRRTQSLYLFDWAPHSQRRLYKYKYAALRNVVGFFTMSNFARKGADVVR